MCKQNNSNAKKKLAALHIDCVFRVDPPKLGCFKQLEREGKKTLYVAHKKILEYRHRNQIKDKGHFQDAASP